MGRLLETLKTCITLNPSDKAKIASNEPKNKKTSFFGKHIGIPSAFKRNKNTENKFKNNSQPQIYQNTQQISSFSGSSLFPENYPDWNKLAGPRYHYQQPIQQNTVLNTTGHYQQTLQAQQHATYPLQSEINNHSHQLPIHFNQPISNSKILVQQQSSVVQTSALSQPTYQHFQPSVHQYEKFTEALKERDKKLKVEEDSIKRLIIFDTYNKTMQNLGFNAKDARKIENEFRRSQLNKSPKKQIHEALKKRDAELESIKNEADEVKTKLKAAPELENHYIELMKKQEMIFTNIDITMQNLGLNPHDVENAKREYYEKESKPRHKDIVFGA